ncbi:hypothetical protein OH76DRAFT_1489694 [Lentinus brumalis]|uniref:Uncharacterized protein n=1 Tax=Lentinus brumalis TaxID=2498619 RepID=A0A371CLP5_9APHY|nr:hypothetical protein OH76DRAFT_1489694 [Polyporus brumalis]
MSRDKVSLRKPENTQSLRHRQVPANSTLPKPHLCYTLQRASSMAKSSKRGRKRKSPRSPLPGLSPLGLDLDDCIDGVMTGVEAHEDMNHPSTTRASPFDLGSPIAVGYEDDGMEISPIMGPAGMLDDASPAANSPLIAISPLWNAIATEDENSPPLLSPVHGGTISPIYGIGLQDEHPFEPANTPELAKIPERAHPPERAPPPEQAPPPERAHPPEQAPPPERAHPPERAPPPERAHPPERAGSAHRPPVGGHYTTRSIHPAATVQSPTSATAAGNATSSIAPRPRISDANASHALNGTVLLNEQSARHLGYLQVDRGAWSSALEAAQGYRMHCATIDWGQWCLYNDALESIAEARIRNVE